MKIEFDFAGQCAGPDYGRQAIKIISALYGFNVVYVEGTTGGQSLAVKAIGEGLAAAQLPLPPALSTAGAATQPTAPVEQAATLPQPPAPLTQSAATSGATDSAPTAYPKTLANGVEVDIHGLPWDARIHSSAKKCNKTGEWQAKRGLNDAALVKKIEAELLAVMAIPAAPVQQVTQAVGIYAPAPPPPVVAAPLPPMDAAAVFATPPAPPAAPVATPGAVVLPVPTTLQELMPRLTQAIMETKVTSPQFDAILAEVGIAGGVMALAHRPDLVPQVWNILSARHGLV